MPKLTIVAHITAKPEASERVKKQLHALIPPTRAEDGCLQYDLHQDDEKPAHFMFYENWESREHWLAHMQSAHLKHFQAASDGLLEELTIHEMTHID